MGHAVFLWFVVIILFSSLMLLAGMYMLAKFNRLFKSTIKNELLRKNIVVWLIAACLIFSVSPTTHDFDAAVQQHKLLQYYLFVCMMVTLEALFVFNVSRITIGYLRRKKLSFRTRMAMILLTIIVANMIMGIPINFLGNMAAGRKYPFESLEYTLLFNFYIGCMAGLVYITISFVH